MRAKSNSPSPAQRQVRAGAPRTNFLSVICGMNERRTSIGFARSWLAPRLLLLGISAALTLFLVGSSRSEDSFPPCWRGNPGTTYANWSFAVSNNPAIPEVFTNVNGLPQATFVVGAFGTGWKSLAVGGRTGVWDLGQAGSASLAVPNFGGSPAWKYIQVQVTYFDAPGFYLPPVISIAGATMVGSQVTNNQVAAPGNWKTYQTVWLLQPSPASETIALAGDASKGLLIDQIVVDTRCPTEAPTIICPPDLTDVHTDTGHCYATSVVLGVPVATNDNCGILTVTNDAPAQFLRGTTTVHWTIMDTSGNSTTCAQNVTVKDHENPVITLCPTNRVLAGCPAQVPTLTGEVVATDNCSTSFRITQDPPAGASIVMETTVVTITVQDEAGNSTTCNPTITLAPPTLSITGVGQTVTLIWPAGGTLLEADALMGPWSPVNGAASPYTLPQPLANMKFYRLQCD